MSTREKIKEVLKKTGSRYMSPRQIWDSIPNEAKPNMDNVYASLSAMTLHYNELERDDKHGYRLKSGEKESIVVRKVTIKKHVVWSEEEKANLAAETYRIRCNIPHPMTTAFEMAQREVLPPERRRKINGQEFATIWEWLEPALRLARATAKRMQPPGNAPTASVAAPPSVLNAPSNTSAPPNANFLLAELLKMGRATLKEVLIEALTSKEFINALFPEMNTTEIEQTTAKVEKHNPSPVSTERPRLPRIMIIGLPKAHQQHEVEREYEGKLDVRFASTDAPPQQVKSSAVACDKIILMTDHINHKIRDSFKHGNFEHELLSGHISRLKERLTEITKEYMQ